MPSTYTPNLRLEKQGIGENQNTWGQKLNATIAMVEDAISGHSSISVSSGTITLSAVNNAQDQARNHILEFNGSLSGNVIVEVPAVGKTYMVWDSTTRNGYDISLRLGGAGNTFAVPEMTSSAGALLSTNGTVWRSTYTGMASAAEVGQASNPDKAISPKTLSGAAASNAETEAGAADKKFVTPAGLKGAAASESETQAGSSTRKFVTPAGLKGAAASNSETQTGTSTTKYVTPAGAQSLAASSGETQSGATSSKFTTPAGIRALVASQGEVFGGINEFKTVAPSTLKAVMDSRLNTTGDLGTAARKDEGPGNGLDADTLDGKHGNAYIQKSEFNPAAPTLVWSGASTSVSSSSLSQFGLGLYILESGSTSTLIAIYDTSSFSSSVARLYTPSNSLEMWDFQFDYGTFKVDAVYDANSSSISKSSRSLTAIYKL